MSTTDQLLVFLVDDHPLVREGLSHLLQEAGFSLVGEAENASETLEHPALAQNPLVIVDLGLGDEDGIELIQQLHTRELPVLAFSMHEGASAIRRAIDAGAGGYVTKREAAHSLLDAIRAVHAGKRYLSPRVQAALREPSPLDGLSSRQLQIYQLLGRGCGNEEIARQLNISVRTLESYCVRIMDKLDVHGGIKELRQQAIRAATAEATPDALGSRQGAK